MSFSNMPASVRATSIEQGFIPEPVFSVQEHNSTLPPEILNVLTPMLKDCSLSELRRQYPVLDVYFQTSAYSDLCDKIFNVYMEYLREADESLAIKFENEFLYLVQELTRIQSFIELVRSQLDILGTIDHLPEGDELWQLAFDGKTPIQVWRKFVRDNSQTDIRSRHDFQKPKALVDEASTLLRRMSLQTRRASCVQRVLNAILTAHRKGWYVIFDTLTLRDDMVSTFYTDTNALRDHFRNIGRLVLTAENRSTKESYNDCFEYFCVPEYGSKEGRLHFHAIYVLRTLPRGSVDPNLGSRTRDRRQLGSLQGIWPYGFSSPIAVRYRGDAFGRAGWLWPVDKNGKPIDSKPEVAVAYYVTKYVNKKTDQDSIRLQLNVTGESWNKTLSQILQNLPKHTFKTRMSRGFGYELPPMDNLPTSSLLELTRLSSKVTPLASVVKSCARRNLRSRLGTLSLRDILAAKPVTTNLLKSLRLLMQTTTAFNPQSFIDSMTLKLRLTDISDETTRWLTSGKLLRSFFKQPNFTAGCK